MGEPLFDDALAGVLSLYVEFESHLPEGKLEPWKTTHIQAGQQTYHAIRMGNQLFTTPAAVDGASETRILPITSQMDPDGHVQRARGERFYKTRLTVTQT